jgi:hypothetical protein|tara:strand:+ start:868 stop:1524 length:657 start_codon:yes stop_codon:yes gene_type:complete
MTEKTYFPAGAKITLADGTYKNIEDIVEGDGVQTYEMSNDEFDSANLHLNEQTDTKVKFIYSEEANLKDFIKIEFKQLANAELDLSNKEIEEIENIEVQSLTVSKCGSLMGGSNLGWMVYAKDELLSFLNKNTVSVEFDDEGEMIESVHDFAPTITQMEVGQHITTDSGKNLKEFEVTAITDYIDEDEEITAYSIDALESGDTVFVNDVLVKVNGADV